MHHLYHKQGNVDSENDEILKDAIKNGSKWCEIGIDSYL